VHHLDWNEQVRLSLGASFRRALESATERPMRVHHLRRVAKVFAAGAGASRPELMAASAMPAWQP